MLVLSRMLGESIVIGKDIRVTVVDIDRGKIRVGIEAPREVLIYREEVLPRTRSTKSANDQEDRASQRDHDSGREGKAGAPPSQET